MRSDDGALSSDHSAMSSDETAVPSDHATVPPDRAPEGAGRVLDTPAVNEVHPAQPRFTCLLHFRGRTGRTTSFPVPQGLQQGNEHYPAPTGVTLRTALVRRCRVRSVPWPRAASPSGQIELPAWSRQPRR